MKIVEKATAGTPNTRDCLITIKPGRTIIKIKSKTKQMFEDHIKDIATQILDEHDVTGTVEIEENGALDYVIQARLEAAISRSIRREVPTKRPRRGKTLADRPRRTRLYVPGNNPRFINSVATYGCDCTILDLEDSVVVDRKHDARYLIK